MPERGNNRWKHWEPIVFRYVKGDKERMKFYHTAYTNRLNFCKENQIPRVTIERQDLDDPLLTSNDFLAKVDVIIKRRRKYLEARALRKKFNREIQYGIQ